MKILVINGDCIQTNTSANLCHLAYICGLLDAGHEVSLLSADGRNYKTDPAMVIPAGVKHYTIYGTSFYERISLKKRERISKFVKTEIRSVQGSEANGGIMQRLKSAVLTCYGVHGIYATFVRRAQKFRSDVAYDYVISISTPVTSHLLTHNLLKTGHIKATHWIQIWEDPWYSDAYGFNGKTDIFNEEKRLLSFAERICYVSPLTLNNQQRLFPESAEKMFWMPLPAYYKNATPVHKTYGRNIYGYFGDYAPAARDLEPFYTAADKAGVEVNICGNPSNLFRSTDKIHIHPRIPLAELKPIEDNTNVLVFLCNRQGGQIPGKIYQYSATDKTILFILDGTYDEQAMLKDYFGKFNRYVFCQNTVEDITRAIRQIESGDIGSVQNVSLDDFEPAKIVKSILEATR